MNTKLHIGNLQAHTTEQKLSASFKAAGFTDVKIQVVMRRDAACSRGFAFVEMGSEVEAVAAVEALHGTDVDGRAVRVSLAHPPSRPMAASAPTDAAGAPSLRQVALPPYQPGDSPHHPAAMHDTKVLIARTRQYAVEHRGRSWWHLASTLSVLLGAASLAALAPSWPIRLFASVGTGLVLVRMFVIYHDTQHGSILRGSRLASWMMTLYGLLVLNPRSIWTRSHDHHHRIVGQTYGSSIGSFPIMTRAAWQAAAFGRRLRYRLQRHAVTIALGYVTVFLYGACVRSFLVDGRKHWDAGVAVLLHAALVVTLAILAPQILVHVLVLPMLVACALGSYLFYAQHNYPAVRIMDRRDWSFSAAALTASSYMEMGPVMRWFTGNIGFHHVHHLNPRIPFYRLPEAMKGIEELQQPGTTSLKPSEIRRCLRLTFWDPELMRMVPQ